MKKSSEIDMTSMHVTILDGKGGSTLVELQVDIPVSELGIELAHKIDHPDLPPDDTPFKPVLKVEDTNEVIPLDMCLKEIDILPGERIYLLLKSIPEAILGSEYLLRFNGPGLVHPKSRIYPFESEDILIGRVDPDSGIISGVLGVDLTSLDDLDRPSVSRKHAQVLHRSEEYLLQDLNSTNGTIVNGNLLAREVRCPLEHGDVIRFGDIVLYFIWDGQQVDRSAN